MAIDGPPWLMERRGAVARVPGMRATATRAAPKDTHSFESFYRGQVDTVYRALALTLTDSGLAREATDEAMLRAYARWPIVGGYDNPSGWVYRVGLNWATSRWRQTEVATAQAAAGQRGSSHLPRSREDLGGHTGLLRPVRVGQSRRWSNLVNRVSALPARRLRAQLHTDAGLDGSTVFRVRLYNAAGEVVFCAASTPAGPGSGSPSLGHRRPARTAARPSGLSPRMAA
jgi:DNA-directed RNA polymerase specialized sigma24 family protein